MRLIGCLVALVALSLAVPARAEADDKPTVAVLGVLAPRDHDLARSADAMTAVIRKMAGAKGSNYSLTGTVKEVAAATMTAECSAILQTCAVQLGTTLDADYTIAGELDRRGTHQILTLALVDVQTMKRIRSVRQIGSAKGDAKKLARTAYARLVDGDDGELALVANAQQGEVILDGQIVAALFEGKTTIQGLVNGTHQLAIRAKGYRPFVIDITIEFATKQNVLLEPELAQAP